MNRSRVSLGSGLTPLVLRDLLRDRLRDLLLSPSLLVKLTPSLQSSLLLEMLNSSCRQSKASMLRGLQLRVESFCFVLAGSALRLVLLELQEVLSLHVSINTHQAVLIIQDTLV